MAGDLLAAADHPVAHLRGVSAFQARLRVAEVLVRAGNRDEGVAVLRNAVAKADPSADAAALITAAGVLLDATGDTADQARRGVRGACCQTVITL
ncbi:MAG TPA: hypothetical protein VLM11_15030 [Streptosporangiaceae bacterium]|nr:hypothetical protein [Streptosporangiaceae bacterium]